MDDIKAQQFRLVLHMARQIDQCLIGAKYPAHIKPALDASLHGAQLSEVYCAIIAHYSSLGYYVQREGTYGLVFIKEA